MFQPMSLFKDISLFCLQRRTAFCYDWLCT